MNQGRQLFFFLLLAVILFGFQEILFRFVFPLPEIANFNRVNYSMMVSGTTEDQPWPLRNESYIWASDPDGVEFTHHLNIYGFRDRNWPVEGDNRIMFVGDSFVEGFMASDIETIPAGFEAAASAAGVPAQTMNLGTGAAGIADYLAVIRDAVPIFQPDTVVLVLYANDFPAEADVGRHLNSGVAAVRSNNWLPRLYVVASDLIDGKRVATRWSKKPFMFLPDAESARSPLHDAGFETHVKAFVDPEILSSMQTGRFNPFVINEYTNYATYLSAPLKIDGVLERTRQYIETHGGQLMVVHIPYRSQVSDYYLDYTRKFDMNKQPVSLMAEEYQTHAEYLKNECARLGIPYLDMTDFLRQHEAAGDHMYWDYDEHMKGSSYLLTGEEIFRASQSFKPR